MVRKKLAGVALVATLVAGGGPLVQAARANGNDGGGTTDPVLCFVATESIIREALSEFREGHLTGRELRAVLRGASAFLGDCLTP